MPTPSELFEIALREELPSRHMTLIGRDALFCAAHLEVEGVDRVTHIGPFSDLKWSRGDRVRVASGTLVKSTGPNGGVIKRSRIVTVFDFSAGYIDRVDGVERLVNPTVHWVGTGSYWCWCDANAVSIYNDESKDVPNMVMAE